MHTLPRLLRPLRAPAAASALLLGALLAWPTTGAFVSPALAQGDGALAPANPFESGPSLAPPLGRAPAPGTWWNECPYADLNTQCQRHESFYDPSRGLYFNRERGGWRADAQSRDFHREPYRNPSRTPGDRSSDPFRSPWPPSGSGDPFSTSPYSRDPFATSPYDRDPFANRPNYNDPFPSRPPDRDRDGWRGDRHRDWDRNRDRDRQWDHDRQWDRDRDRGRGWDHAPNRRPPSGGGVYEYRPRTR